MKPGQTIRFKIHVHKEEGQFFLNGVEIGRYAQGFQITHEAGKGTMVKISMLVDEVEMEGTDVLAMIEEMRPPIPGPRLHEYLGTQYAESPNDICRVCRQTRRVAMPECPGPIKR